MEQKRLGRWLHGVLIGVLICGAIGYGAVLPCYAVAMRGLYPEFSNRFWPWLLFLWATGIPVFAALGILWKVASNVGRDQAFSHQNERLFHRISAFALADTGFFFVGNVALFALGLSHPSVLLASFGVVFAGIAAAVVFSVLSRLVQKAVRLQEENDLTI